jgi:hypothetical protein
MSQKRQVSSCLLWFYLSDAVFLMRLHYNLSRTSDTFLAIYPKLPLQNETKLWTNRSHFTQSNRITDWAVLASLILPVNWKFGRTQQNEWAVSLFLFSDVKQLSSDPVLFVFCTFYTIPVCIMKLSWSFFLWSFISFLKPLPFTSLVQQYIILKVSSKFPKFYCNMCDR